MAVNTNTKALGIVIDMSLKHADGRRLVEHVKNALRDYLRAEMNDGDIVYVYHPLVTESVYTVGEAVSCVQNFEADWRAIDKFAAKQAWYVLMQEDFEVPKKIIYVTDRLTSLEKLRSLTLLNKDQYCEINVLTIGEEPLPPSDLPVQVEHITSHLDIPDVLRNLLWKTSLPEDQ